MPEFGDETPATHWGTVFFRGYDPAKVADRVPAEHHVKGPEVTWYGMNELTLRDPDGNIVTLATPDGDPPPEQG